MRILWLFWRLLRYRVAVMLVLFMLLAAAIHQVITTCPWALTVAALALACSYVSATSSNDLADVKIDAINHPDSPGRPLITGQATTREIRLVFALASVAANTLAALINLPSGLLMLTSILLNILYSLPPARLSYRTFLAPLILGVAYVGIPYALALTATDISFTGYDRVWLAGLYLMFVGRIILKDFRDRQGDARYRKPTFLLRYGKRAACLVSLIGLTAGGALLIWQSRQPVWLAAIIAAYLASIAIMLRRLWQAPVGREEQISIGVGARMGNGLLITLLAFFSLQASHASPAMQAIITLAVSTLFFGSYANFLRHPEAAMLGYKG
jgi:4-hydroxybenzoate polyprenyltransferase